MVERDIPSSQRKVDSNDDGDTAIQTMERAEELSSQYEEIRDRTVDDDTVLGKLMDIDTSENNSRIIVHIDLPGEGSDKMCRFRKPKVWSDEYDFVRWIRYYDYDADSFPNMLEDHCKVKVTRLDGGYEIFVPEKDKSLSESVPSVDVDGKKAKVRKVLRDIRTSYVDLEGPTITFALLVVLMIHGVASLTGLVNHGIPTDQYGGMFIISTISLLVLAIIEVSVLKRLEPRHLN